MKSRNLKDSQIVSYMQTFKLAIKDIRRYLSKVKNIPYYMKTVRLLFSFYSFMGIVVTIFAFKVPLPIAMGSALIMVVPLLYLSFATTHVCFKHILKEESLD